MLPTDFCIITRVFPFGTVGYDKKKQPFTVAFLWCWEESNCRHMDFQSIALPSELQHHRLWTTKIGIFPEFANFFRVNLANAGFAR